MLRRRRSPLGLRRPRDDAGWPPHDRPPRRRRRPALRRPVLRGRRLRLRSLLGPDPDATRQGFAALAVALLASFVAGLTLGSIEGTLEDLPGLLVLVPAAIGMRGTIFGALGSRLSTAIHTGTFSLAPRADTVVGQNVLASASLSLSAALALALLAKLVAVAFGLGGTISVPELVVISIVAAVLSSAVVLVLTVGLAALSVRAGWDSDNVLAPIITAAGDMVTLPALFLATLVIELDRLTPPLAVLLSVLSIAVPAAALRSTLTLLRRILVESFPVVVAAGVLQLVAGLTIESRLASFTALPALLVLVPPFLAAAGALGGLLSSRLSSALHLGLMAPTGLPRGPARVSIALVLVLAVPLFTLCSVVADAGSAVTGLASPGALRLLGVTVVGGAVATGFVVLVAYYGTIVAVRLGLDPDTYGIPVVTASVDLVGAFALVLGILAVGVG